MTLSLIIIQVPYPNTHRVRLFRNLSAEKPAARIPTSEARMHQDRFIHNRNEKHNCKDRTSVLESTRIDFTVSLPL